MSIFGIAKLAAHVVAGLGVHKIVQDIIANNVNVVTNADAVKVAAGSIVIASMAVENASDHLDMRIKQLVTWYEDQKEKDKNDDEGKK